MKMKRRMVAVLMAALLVTAIPLPALAEVVADISLGDVSIDDVEVSHYVAVEGGGSTQKTEAHDGSVTVTQSNPSTPTSNTISVTTTTSDVNVTLDNVNINTSPGGGAAMSVTRGEDTTVTVELDGTNSLTSAKSAAGLQTSGEGKLVIQDSNHDGSLTAQGGTYGAGIGGGYGGDGSGITISGGEVTAKGGASGAGIGGGYRGDGSDITIIGNAQITATGESGASDIGKGKGGKNQSVDTSGLYTTGSINEQPGTVEPPKPTPSSASAVPAEAAAAAPATFNEDDFWNDVIAQIRAAKKGDTITIDAGGLTTMPQAVMEALAECGVTLVIHWIGGEDIVIDTPITDETIWVFSFYTLPQLLAK